MKRTLFLHVLCVSSLCNHIVCRGQLEIKTSSKIQIPIEEVESAAEIVKRFVTGETVSDTEIMIELQLNMKKTILKPIEKSNSYNSVNSSRDGLLKLHTYIKARCHSVRSRGKLIRPSRLQ